jgi:acyl-coenzyme A thioesterase PaaI-like protein
MREAKALQNLLPKENPIRHCYGCGVDNPEGLGIKSHMAGDEGIARWRPQEHQCSYPGFLNGGIACTIMDCHSAWTAFAMYCREKGIDMTSGASLPTGWTRALQVEFLKAVPMDGELVLRARVIKKGTTSRTVACSIYANDVECVKGEVTMVMTGG